MMGKMQEKLEKKGFIYISGLRAKYRTYSMVVSKITKYIQQDLNIDYGCEAPGGWRYIPCASFQYILLSIQSY